MRVEPVGRRVEGGECGEVGMGSGGGVAGGEAAVGGSFTLVSILVTTQSLGSAELARAVTALEYARRQRSTIMYMCMCMCMCMCLATIIIAPTDDGHGRRKRS